jgi:hypothetical protein
MRVRTIVAAVLVAGTALAGKGLIPGDAAADATWLETVPTTDIVGPPVPGLPESSQGGGRGGILTTVTTSLAADQATWALVKP